MSARPVPPFFCPRLAIIPLLVIAAMASAVDAPVVDAPAISASATPTWTWHSANPGADDQFQFNLGNDDFSGAITSDRFGGSGTVGLTHYTYDPQDADEHELMHGDSVTLHVRQFTAGAWSPVASATIVIDRQGPLFTIDGADGQLIAGTEVILHLTAEEAVAGLDPSHLQPSAGTVQGLVISDDDASRLQATLILPDFDHELTLTIGSDLCTDFAGNACIATTTTPITVSSGLAAVQSRSVLTTLGLGAGIPDIGKDTLGLDDGQLWRWNGDLQEYASAERLDLGHGYFALDPSGLAPTGISAPATGTMAIILHDGWNLISLPYHTPYHWDRDLIVASLGGEERLLHEAGNWIEAHAWIYDPQTADYLLVHDRLTDPGTTDTIPAWSAFWIYAHRDGVTLRFDDHLDSDG